MQEAKNSRKNNPIRTKLTKEIVDLEFYELFDLDENDGDLYKEYLLRKKFDDTFIEAFNMCEDARKKDDMLISAILEVYPEAIKDYKILSVKDKMKKKWSSEMSVYDKIKDNKVGISECEEKIEQLEKEINELKQAGQSAYIEVLEKKLEIGELEVEIIELQGLNDRLSKSAILKDLQEKKDGKQFLEHKYLSECYANNNELQRLYETKNNLDLKARIMIAKKQQGTREFQELQEQIKGTEVAISIAEKNLEKSVQLYDKQGGLQGHNIDFSVPYSDILAEYNRSNDYEPVKYTYDIMQLHQDTGMQVADGSDVKAIQDNVISIFSNGLDGSQKELAEIYGEVFSHNAMYGNHFFEHSTQLVENMLGEEVSFPEEIIKKDDGKYIVVYANDKGEKVGIPCTRDTKSGKLEVIGGDGKTINSQEISRMHKIGVYESITYEQMEMQVVKNNIEKSIKDGQVTEILEIKDKEMLEYFNKQNNLQQYSSVSNIPKVYMISRQDEDGKIHYEFVSHNNANDYTKISGMQQVQVEQKNIVIAGQRMQGAPTPMQKVENQFIDNNGKRYFMYHEFGNGSMNLAQDALQQDNSDKTKVESNDYGLNNMFHNARVSELFRAGRNALGVGYEKVKEIINKYRSKENIQQQDSEKTMED